MQIADDVYESAFNSNLAGLAFSGGGIRSATFSLGVIQALSRYGLLSHVDVIISSRRRGGDAPFVAGLT